ncbi:unnamed protein product, partial [Adineta steineri]
FRFIGNCYSHILHNGVKHAHDDLLIDIDQVLCKIYSFFSNSAKRVQELKLYYDFVQSEYRVLLEHITIRWLSLLPSIQRLIESYVPIKNYFLDQQITTTTAKRTAKNLQILKSFFEDDCGLCILIFVENVLVDIQRAELKLQRISTTTVNLYVIITNLIRKLEQRLKDKYYGNKAHIILNQLITVDASKAKQLQDSFQSFIESIIKYINSYFDRDRGLYKKLSVFDCESDNFLKWDCLKDIVNLFKINDLDKDEIYNEYCDIKFIYDEMKNKTLTINEQIKLYISNKNIYNPKSVIQGDRVSCDTVDDDNDNNPLNNDSKANECIQSDQLWSYLLNIKPNTTPNMKLVVAYAFSIPCSNS